MEGKELVQLDPPLDPEGGRYMSTSFFPYKDLMLFNRQLSGENLPLWRSCTALRAIIEVLGKVQNYGLEAYNSSSIKPTHPNVPPATLEGFARALWFNDATSDTN